jgi:hypothetical protein
MRTHDPVFKRAKTVYALDRAAAVIVFHEKMGTRSPYRRSRWMYVTSLPLGCLLEQWRILRHVSDGQFYCYELWWQGETCDMKVTLIYKRNVITLVEISSITGTFKQWILLYCVTIFRWNYVRWIEPPTEWSIQKSQISKHCFISYWTQINKYLIGHF